MLLPDDSFIQQHGGCQFELVEIPKSVFKIIKISSLDCGIARLGEIVPEQTTLPRRKGKVFAHCW